MYVRKNEKLANSKEAASFFLNMTTRTARTGMAMFPIIFLIGASVVISSGMAMPAMALPAQFDDKGDSPLKDFDIKQYFIDSDGALNIQLYGKAGRTVPEHMHDVYAYVVFTNDGIYATDSHEAQHAEGSGETTANKAWHGHKVVLDEDLCLTEIGSLSAEAKMAGSNVKIVGSTATEIIMVQTVMLELLVEDPDDVPPGTCIAQVREVFDTAVGL